MIGAIHVGAIDDHGYNQAHHDGLQQAIQQVPGICLIEASSVPESDQVTTEIDNMVQQGAKIIFVQSFGYLPFALKAAEKYPDVIFLHPGGHELRVGCTYWANNFEAMYLAGIAAGATRKTGRLGFITGFAIPNILASVNAFQLGAQTVNPNAKTALIIDSAWVDPVKEEAATNALANAGVDVVAMIVDSPTTVVKTAEARNRHLLNRLSLAYAATICPQRLAHGGGLQLGQLLRGGHSRNSHRQMGSCACARRH